MEKNIRGWRTHGYGVFVDVLDEYNLKCMDGCYKDNIDYNFIRDKESHDLLFIVPETDMDNFDEYYQKYKMELRINKINKIRK